MNTKSNAILCFLYKFVVFNSSFEKIEKHSSSCKGERYSVLFLLISRLTVAGQSPAYPVLYASLQRKLGSNSAGIAYFATKTDLVDCHCI